MKHLIIGAGVVGEATGYLLEAHGEIVSYVDRDPAVIDRLEKAGKQISEKNENVFDIYWICTAEWDTEGAIKAISETQRKGALVVVRSTVPPGEMVRLIDLYGLHNAAHVPEFLRVNSYLEDIFHPDRVIIGSFSRYTKEVLTELYTNLHPGVPIITTDPNTSEMIKLTANAWLSAQISFWNDIMRLCKNLKVSPQMVSNACTLDKRISVYGSKMIFEPFGGFCLPKDLNTLKNAFRNKKVTSKFLDLIEDVNKEVEEKKK